MATVYKNISSATTETLIDKITSSGSISSGNKVGNPGGISKITISNHDNTDQVIVKLYLDDGGGVDANNPYTVAEVTIPPLVTLILNDNLSFDASVYSLKIDTSTTAEITVIIK